MNEMISRSAQIEQITEFITSLDFICLLLGSLLLLRRYNGLRIDEGKEGDQDHVKMGSSNKAVTR